MAKNEYGFIQKKYRQPRRYELIFCNWNALYETKQGNTIMVEAIPHCLCSNKHGAKIDRYQILLKEPTCRRPLTREVTTQKQAMEILEKYLAKF